MNNEQRDQLIHYLAEAMQDSWSLGLADFIDGFEFTGFGNMTDDELIDEAEVQGWDDEEWFKEILVAHELKKAIAKAE